MGVNITEFLEARIAEDESTAGPFYGTKDYLESKIGEWDGGDRAGLDIPASRLRAECKAKRAIVELHGPIKDDGWLSGEANGYLWCGSCGSIDDSPEPFPCDTLKAVAAVYADHPDYQQEWAL